MRARHRTTEPRRALCLLLALALALAPLWSLAQPMPASQAAGEPVAQMPCHGGDAQHLTTAPADHDCPHCNGDAPASQCHCCAHAAPAGPATDAVRLHTPDTLLPHRLAMLSDALPHAPAGTLFRPPIPHS